MEFVNEKPIIYLLQRLTVSSDRSLKRIQKDEIPLSVFFEFDYMGSAEYEFGAAAKAIRQFTREVDTFTKDDYIFVNRDITHYFRIPGTSRTSKKEIPTYFIFKSEVSKEYINEYISQFQDVIHGNRRLKERIKGCSFSGFKIDAEVMNTANFDIQNAVFIYYNNTLSHVVLELFRNSIRIINKQ